MTEEALEQEIVRRKQEQEHGKTQLQEIDFNENKQPSENYEKLRLNRHTKRHTHGDDPQYVKTQKHPAHFQDLLLILSLIMFQEINLAQVMILYQ